jgi:acetate kinase
MKTLVINSGSSSIKYQLFDMVSENVLSHGLVEKIGEPQGVLHHSKVDANQKEVEIKINDTFADHHQGLEKILGLLSHETMGVLDDISEIDVVGHRVVHGGEHFKAPTLIDDTVIEAIKANIPLAPLHNPANLTGIEVAKAYLPRAIQVAVFDTAFHQTIPPRAFMYALPYELYEKQRVRRYGFHGTSHSFVANRAAELLEQKLQNLKLITIHLGNGASMAAVDKGCCVDTTMGMTPLEGLIMGTRTGDVDPAIPFFLADHLNMALDDIVELMNKQSGLKGICGTNDMREVVEKMEQGNKKAKLAFEMFGYRIRKYLGAYIAVLGGLDAIVFTAGIGENSPIVRKESVKGLGHMGIVLDDQKNTQRLKTPRKISTDDSSVAIFVIPTNEELKIARECFRLTSPVSSPFFTETD